MTSEGARPLPAQPRPGNPAHEPDPGRQHPDRGAAARAGRASRPGPDRTARPTRSTTPASAIRAARGSEPDYLPGAPTNPMPRL